MPARPGARMAVSSTSVVNVEGFGNTPELVFGRAKDIKIPEPPRQSSEFSEFPVNNATIFSVCDTQVPVLFSIAWCLSNWKWPLTGHIGTLRDWVTILPLNGIKMQPGLSHRRGIWSPDGLADVVRL
jgi:hypothetical protein